MRRNLKVLGLVLGAVFAMSAMSAAGASAAGEHFHSTEENVVLTGETVAGQQPKLEIGNVEVVCEKGTYQGTVTGKKSENGTYTSESVTVHPKYDEPCSIGGAGGIKAEVSTNGCDYKLTSNTVETTPGVEHAKVEVECTSGSFITIKGAGCTIEIGAVPEETLADGVKYFNKEAEGKKTVTVESTVKEIPYKSKGAFCGLVGIPKEGHNGMYTDDVMVKGYEDLNGPCSKNSTTHELTCTEGKEVSTWWE